MLIVAAAALFVRLGIWQLQRLAERRAFNAQVEEMQLLPPVALAAEGTLEKQEYRKVIASGSFDFANQMAIRNQVLDGQYGYHLLTPLVLADQNGAGGGRTAAVLVDRGWIPATQNDSRIRWERYDAPGTVHVSGVIRLGWKDPGWIGLMQPTPLPENGGDEFVFYVDLQQIGQSLPYKLLPVYIQLDGSSNRAGIPIASAPIPTPDEGPHMGYAAQWFGLAGLLLIGYPLYVHRKKAPQA